jgi:hypothetical protein
LIDDLICTNVRLDVICAVRTEITKMLTSIQRNATHRPPWVIGALSPYPTVLMVTMDHQRPETIPAFMSPPNWSGFFFRSSHQMRDPSRSKNRNSPTTNFRIAGELKVRKTSLQGVLVFLETAMPRPV